MSPELRAWCTTRPGGTGITAWGASPARPEPVAITRVECAFYSTGI